MSTRGRVAIWAFILSLAAAGAACARGAYDVTSFGALGDGKIDDAAAFQKALDAAEADGGGVVSVPTGEYLIKSHLTIPPHVTLEGVWRAPVRGLPVDAGSVLLATEGKGEPEGTPFIVMNTDSVLKGLSIFYPEQIIANPPHAYPWTIQSVSGADNCTIRDVTLINPYQAVDFGTHMTGRHYVSGLYGYPLFKGLYVNQCYDVGRIENVHFWPFWDVNPESPLWAFTKQNATAFIIGRTDGEMVSNCFSIFYRVGIHFIAGPIEGSSKTSPGSGVYTNCYMDITPCAVRVDEVAADSGVSFVNGMFMSGAEISEKNKGPVKFTACGFWANRGLKCHAKLAGRGTVIFESCHFSNWDQQREEAACIEANNARLIVNGCDFQSTRDKHWKVTLGPRVRSAIVSSNLMGGGVLIRNNAPEDADIQIGLNAGNEKPGYLTDWLVLGPFPNPRAQSSPPGQPSRTGYETDYLAGIGGEREAVLTPATKVEYPGPEGKAQLAQTCVIEPSLSHHISFKEVYPDGNSVAYAFCYLDSPEEQTAHFEFGANDASKVWINGDLAFSHWDEEGGDSQPGAHAFDARLQKGLNTVLVKVEDAGGRRWEFVMEAYDESGKPLIAKSAV